jgi:hypothetical protein
MANAFVEDGFIESGFFEELVPIAPAILDLGLVGAAAHRLPFRALGGSVADFDLLYGIVGREDAEQDVQPLFGLMSRTGLIRVFGREVPRQGILDAPGVIEAYATLKRVEPIVIEANPAGPNLFGSVALTTRPISSVTIDNSDGYWDLLTLRELILGAPAGLFYDIGHEVIMPVLVGTISAYEISAGEIVLSYGMVAKRRVSPQLAD